MRKQPKILNWMKKLKRKIKLKKECNSKNKIKKIKIIFEKITKHNYESLMMKLKFDKRE